MRRTLKEIWLKLKKISRYTSIRLSLSLLISVVIIVSIYTAFSYQQAVRILEKESSSAAMQTIERTAKHIEHMLQQYNNFAEMVAYDQNVINKLVVLAKHSSPEDQELAEIKLEQLLKPYIYANQFVESITLYSNDQSRVISTYPINLINPIMKNNNAEKIRTTDWFAGMDFSDKDTIILDARKEAYISTNTSAPYFAVAHNVIDPLNPKSSIGTLLLEISTEQLHNALDSFKLGNNGGYVILSDDHGRIIYSSDPKATIGSYYEGQMPGEAASDLTSHTTGTFYSNDSQGIMQYYVYQQSKLAGWYIMGYYPESQLLEPMHNLLRNSVLLAFVFSLAAILCVGFLVQRGVGTPLHNLHKVMIEGGDGNLKVRTHNLPDNEIGDLGRTFNRMMDQISLAYYDTLTHLPNRRYLIDIMEKGLAKAKEENSRLAVMFVDLDQLKKVNDSLGHHAGDLLLQLVAGRLQSCVNGRDTVARMAGDEFVVLLPRVEHFDIVNDIAQNIIEKLREPFIVMEDEIYISASIGIAFFPDDADDVESLLKLADMAMYQVKGNGKDSYLTYQTMMGIHRQEGI